MARAPDEHTSKMVAASKLAPSTAKQFVAFFESLGKTDVVAERLVLLGLATRGKDGELVLREDVRGPLEDLKTRLRASLAAGLSSRDAIAAAALNVDHDEVTHVIYGLFLTAGGIGAYIGESENTPTKRFKHHPKGCTKLAAAMEATGGKGNWTCAVLLVLPEDSRSKELLLYIEAELQRLLDTVDGVGGLNCHYGRGTYSGAPDEKKWIANYVELIEFVSKHGKLPSQKAKDAADRTLGIWASNQRQTREKMSTHRRKALDALGDAWQWRIYAPYVTNAVLFEKLRADERVTSSGGLDIPVDISGVGVKRVVKARQRYKTKEMPKADRAIVDTEFPGLTMTAPNASFLLSAKAFAEKHPTARTMPSCASEPSLYKWLKHVRDGHTDMDDPWRKKVLEDLKLSPLLETLKPPGVRAATIAANRARNAERHVEESGARAEAREAKKRRKIAAIEAGPPANA